MPDYPDYKELYLKMLRASEQAINILINAQRECEELYISSPETNFTVLNFCKGDKKTPKE